MTGGVDFKRGYIDSTATDGTVLYDIYLGALDKNGVQIAQLYSSIYADQAIISALTSSRMVDGVKKTAYVMPTVLANGQIYTQVPPYDENVTNGNAIVNQTVAKRDYLKLDGNISVSSGSTITSLIWNFHPVDYFLEHPTIINVRHDFAWNMTENNPAHQDFSLIAIRPRDYREAEIRENYTSEYDKKVQTIKHIGLNVRNASGVLNGAISIAENINGVAVAQAPAPQENTYSNHIDTLQASINRHPVNIDVVTSTRQLYLGGANASDTANLWQGRGTSPEMPFASIGAIFRYLQKLNGNGDSVVINIQSDIAFSNTFAINTDNLINVVLKGLNDNKAIKLMNGSANHGFLQLIKGKLELCFLTLKNIGVYASGYPASEIVLGKNIDFVCDQNIVLINSFGSNSRVRILETAVMDFTGTCAVVVQAQESFVEIAPQATLTGSITGKRYVVTNGGIICTFGAGTNKIPGTTAGTCDANSKYF